MMRKITILTLALSLMFTLSACFGQKAAEKAVERAIEKSSDNQADVDIDDGNVSIKTDQGSYEGGENVKLPDDFPADIHVYDGKLLGVIKNNDNNGVTLTIETIDQVATIKKVYEEKMKEFGWEISGSMDFGSSASLSGKKDDRSFSVFINQGDEDEKNSIILTVAQSIN